MFHPIITTLDGGGEQGRNKQKRYKQTLNHNIFIITNNTIIITTVYKQLLLIPAMNMQLRRFTLANIFQPTDERLLLTKMIVLTLRGWV